jgi:hypothetical protein
MKLTRAHYLSTLLILLVTYGCLTTSHSDVYQNLLDKQLADSELGKMKFLYGDMGGIAPHTLKSNGFVYKMAIVALSTVANDNKNNAYKNIKNADSLFANYGFVYAEKILNNTLNQELITKNSLQNTLQNSLSEAPQYKRATGLVFGKIAGFHPTKGKFVVEVADLGCGACHGGPLYGENGHPTTTFVAGMPNASINLDALSHDLLRGYENIVNWNEKQFDNALIKLFPDTKKEELIGLNLFFKTLKKEINKIATTRREPAPYKIGGAGTLNGIGAIKSGLNLINKANYNGDIGALVSIPTLANRNFKSSLLVSGNYAPINKDFFYEINKNDTNQLSNNALAPIVSLFTIGTMGFSAKMAANAQNDAKDVMAFIAKMETPPFPAAINGEKAELGRIVFQNNCQSCHGKYEGSATRNKLVSFPNKLIPAAKIGTDSIRCQAITHKDLETLKSLPQKKSVQAETHNGYVAPILSGIWATAPYFHNASIPTLWHLMHPNERPNIFYSGGHLMDYEKVGIKGELINGVYQYNKNDKTWANYDVFDTEKRGASNKGHEKQFAALTELEKTQLIEFLKTL